MDPLDLTRRKHFSPETPGEDLLVPIFRNGPTRLSIPAAEQMRERAKQQMAMLHPGIKRFD